MKTPVNLVSSEIECVECKGTGLPTRKHSDLAKKCEDCDGRGIIKVYRKLKYNRGEK